VSRRLAENLGGELRLETGRPGATFSFVLPAAGAEAG
jgi:signal transduction histidine kinase